MIITEISKNEKDERFVFLYQLDFIFYAVNKCHNELALF